ncbi:lipid II flippase MurJ [Halobacteriovorax sp. ZH1_bin.1]|uniref:lipid II flippase MurJ n=1 Tax=Halobacteriovorax sp. ZH1_bin.1 TaxID=3157723 RepID=UPI0037141FB3
MNRTIALTSIFVSLGVVLGRAAGYLRELLIAYHFGVSEKADQVVLILTTPDLINNILSVSVLSNAFFPILKKDNNVSKIVEETIAINIVLYLIFLVFAPIFFDGWLLVLMNIAMASVVFNGITFAQATYLSFIKKFKLQSLSTFVFNLGLISILSIFDNLIIIAVGVIFSSALRMLYLIYISNKAGLYFKISFKNVFKNLKVSKRLILAIVANGLVFINPIIDKIFLISFPVGSVSSYSYAEKVYLLPVATVISILPNILYSYVIDNLNNKVNSYSLILKSFIFIGFASLVCSVIFYFFSIETVTLVYYFSKISNEAIYSIALILKYFALAILVSGMNSLIIKLLFACNDDKYVLKASIFGFFFNILANTYILYFYKESKYMALTTSFTAIVVFALIFTRLIIRMGYFDGTHDNRK